MPTEEIVEGGNEHYASPENYGSFDTKSKLPWFRIIIPAIIIALVAICILVAFVYFPTL